MGNRSRYQIRGTVGHAHNQHLKQLSAGSIIHSHKGQWIEASEAGISLDLLFILLNKELGIQ